MELRKVQSQDEHLRRARVYSGTLKAKSSARKQECRTYTGRSAPVSSTYWLARTVDSTPQACCASTWTLHDSYLSWLLTRTFLDKQLLVDFRITLSSVKTLITNWSWCNTDDRFSIITYLFAIVGISYVIKAKSTTESSWFTSSLKDLTPTISEYYRVCKDHTAHPMLALKVISADTVTWGTSFILVPRQLYIGQKKSPEIMITVIMSRYCCYSS